MAESPETSPTNNREQPEEDHYTLKHFLGVGLIAGVLYYLIYLENPILKGSLGAPEYLVWLIAILLPPILYIKGADLHKIRYSFTWSFITIISYVYVPLILLLRLPGIPRVVAILLTPLLVGSFVLSVHEATIAWRETRKLGIRLPLRRRMKAVVYKLDPLLMTFLVTGVIVLTVFLLVPVLLILENAFIAPHGEPFYANFERIFTEDRFVRVFHFPNEKAWFMYKPAGSAPPTLFVTGKNYGVLLNSLINSTIVTTVATILGIIISFVLARYRFPGRTLLRLLAVVPLFVTPFVNSYAVKLLFGPSGPISWITWHLFGFNISIESLAGVTLAQIMAFYPIVYLNAYAGFLGIDPSLEEQAENLGAKGLRLFFTVTLPLALPAIAAGSIIIFIFSLEDLGAPIVFQESHLMSYQIYTSFTSETGLILPEAAALGFVMLGLALVGFITIKNYVSVRSYAMISRGGRWKPRERKLGPLGLAAVYILVFPLVIWTMMPQLTVIGMALNIIPPGAFKIQLSEFTLKYFLDLFRQPGLFIYIRNTLTYAITAVFLATTLSLIIAYTVNRARIRIVTPTLDALSTIPLAIPGLVIALGYYFFFSEFFPGTPLDPASGPTVFQAWIVLIIAYTIRKLPFVVRSIYAGVQQVHENLEEAAMNLGASRRKTLFGIVLPLITAYMLSGAIVGFIYISTEVSTSITIGGFRVDQAPMTWYMMNVFKGGQLEGIQYVAAMGLLLIIFQLIAILIIIVGLKQSYAFIGAG
jgi:iron(III) transport system permease protein